MNIQFVTSAEDIPVSAFQRSVITDDGELTIECYERQENGHWSYNGEQWDEPDHKIIAEQYNKAIRDLILTKVNNKWVATLVRSQCQQANEKIWRV